MNVTIILACLFFCLDNQLLSFKLPTHDFTQDDEPKPLNHQQKEEETPQEEKLPHDTTVPVTPSSQTIQERSIIDAMDELSPIADLLAKFAQSKEAQEIIKAKQEERERKKKESEQRIKSSIGGGRAWRPSSGASSYAPPRQRSARQDYWSPSSARTGGWDSGSRTPSPWTSAPSGTLPGRTAGSPVKSTDLDDVDADDFRKGKTDTTPTTRKKETDEKRSGVIKDEPKREFEASYTRAINYTKQAGDKLKASLEAAEKKETPADIARELLTRNSFSDLQKLLEKADEAKNELREAELKNLEIKYKNEFKKEQDRVDTLYKKLFPHALIAATFDDKTFKEEEQSAARDILRSTPMEKHLNETLINTRTDALLNTWTQEVDIDSYKKNMANIHALKLGNPPPHAAAGKVKDSLEDLKTYFTAHKRELEKIQAQLPTSPPKLTEKIKELENLLK